MDEWRRLKDAFQDWAEKHYPDRKMVFGEGNTRARIMLIGEAPGGDEERVGRPFVGKAGKNLDAFLQAIQLKREEIYISNVVKYRPIKVSKKTGKSINRPPQKPEIMEFYPWLEQEIVVVNPEWVVTLGNVALKAVGRSDELNIGEVHGQKLPWPDQGPNRILFPLYHPASIIYNPTIKTIYEQDLIQLYRSIAAEI